MPPFETLIAFAVATFVFAYMPGPAVLYTASQTLARGRRAGFMTVFGIHFGCYAHVFGAAFGLSAIFAAVPTAYMILKFAGAAYLIYLGIQVIRSRRATGTIPELPTKTSRRAFLDGIVVEVLNPKAAIFFIAFLPQFVVPDASLPIWMQFLILGSIVNFAFASADIVTVLFAGEMKMRLSRSSSFQEIAKWVSGTLLVGLGVKLAVDKA